MKIQRFAYVAWLCLALFSGCSTFTAPKSNQVVLTGDQLTVLPSRAASNLSSPAIGMNLELTNLCGIFHTDALHKNAYEQLYENLGQGVLHIAGHSSDESVWVPGGALACPSTPVATKALVQAVFAFANRIHWRVIWGLSLINNNPQMDAHEAAYVASVGKNTLIGFSIGNEPELYVKHQYRTNTWGFGQYISDWKQIHDVIMSVVPSAKFVGPDTTVQSDWLENFLASVGNDGSIVAASRHYYFYSGKSHSTGLTPVSLLNPTITQRFFSEATGWVSDSYGYKIPVAITETNTISNGGIRGVSNTFAATLWVSNLLFQAANLGIDQVDFQQVPDAAYSFINPQGIPQTIYNGLLFFRLVADEAAFLPSVLKTSKNASAYVFAGNDGTLRIALINKDPTKNMSVDFATGSSYHHMTSVRMYAQSLASTSGVKIGSATVTPDGMFKVPTSSLVNINASQIRLNVPASSATVFTFSS